MDNWELIKRFRNVVEDGKVTDIHCPDCKKPIIFFIGEDDGPIMYCPWCGGTYLPGAGFWADMRAIVSEHYV